MAGRVRTLQNSFTSGELSLRLGGRSDIANYASGAETIENFIVLAQGGLKTRPGTRFVAKVKEADLLKRIRLIPFQFNDEQAYIVEFGQSYFRFYTNTARLENPVGTPVETAHTYLNTELFDVQFDQSADVMWLAHRAHKPATLSRTSAVQFTRADYAPVGDPFIAANIFPRAVALWRSRLWWAGTDSGPNEFWATHVDDFNNLTPGTSLDNEAINGVVAGGKINVIRSLAGLDKQLFVGTYGSEMFIRGDASGKVAPTTVNITPATTHGVASLIPVKAAGYLLFLQRSQRKLRQLTYDFNSDAFIAPDLLLLADQLVGRTVRDVHEFLVIEDVTYAEDPDPIIWGVRSDGQLVGATFLPTHKILGWHRHITEGEFESVAVIPMGVKDQVWVIARRTINGVVRRFVEVFEDEAGHYGQYTLDCALHYNRTFTRTLTLSATTGTGVTATSDGNEFAASDVGDQIWHGEGMDHGALLITQFVNPTKVIGDVVVDFESVILPGDVGFWRLAVASLSGLDHLEGHEVTVLVDGATHPTRVVVGGEIELEQHAGQVEVGLPFTPRLVTLRPEVAAGGTIQGLTATRSNLKVRVLDTVTLTVNGQELPERSTEDNMDVVAPLFAGDLDVDVLGWEDQAKVTITQNTNQPATILSLVSYVHFGDE